jgi:hypothetical protein
MTTTMVRPALKATGLRKSFGEKTALDGIDLALIGPRLARTSEGPKGPPSCPGTLGVRICNSGDPAGWPSG